MGLEAISTIGDVSVSKSTSSGASEWTVTFLNNAGNLPELTADSSAMWGGVAVAVDEQRTGTSVAVSGSFELSVSGNGAEKVTVPHDASYAEVRLCPGVVTHSTNKSLHPIMHSRARRAFMFLVSISMKAQLLRHRSE